MLYALLLTILVSAFFIIGFYISKFIKNKNALILFTTGITLIIMLFLMIFDLIPEILEIFPFKENSILIISFTVLGCLIIKSIDIFIPEHHHNHEENEDNMAEHNCHLFHIGFITAISLIVHNILEGISIYITVMNDLKTGLIMALSVGCHNLPLGIEIAASLEINEKKKWTKYIILLLLNISTFFGAFILFILGKELNSNIEGMLLSITLGMLFYICVIEILPEVIKNKNRKEVKNGMVIGCIIAIILSLI